MAWLVSPFDIPAFDDDFPTGFGIMQPFAALIALMARLLSILTGGDDAGEVAGRRRIADPLQPEPTLGDKVAAWLGGSPLRARRVPVYVRRTAPPGPARFRAHPPTGD